MERYIDAIIDETEVLMESWDPYTIYEAQENLSEWIEAPMKHYVTDYFDSVMNGIYYTRKLYESRVRCFYEILTNTVIDPDIRKIMKKSSSIYSFGCGPGPEIAACICFMRDTLPCKRHWLNITAVDQLGHWRKFVEAIEPLDDYCSITFEEATVSNYYLWNIDEADICIMSYPHAMNFEDIWENIIEKFTLIIFIDQPKQKIKQIMYYHGFTEVEFFYKGEKIFFYYVDELKLDMEPFIYCEEMFKVNLPCGHLNLVYCYQESNLSTLKCKEAVVKRCTEGLHERTVLCGTKFDCEEIVEFSLKCGHKAPRRCCDDEWSERTNRKCSIKEKRKCQRNFHSEIVTCGAEFKCDKSFEVSRRCGHSVSIRCYENESTVFAKGRCLEIVTGFCKRGRHNEQRKCSTDSHCMEPVLINRTCGHKISIKCYQNESTVIDKNICNEMVTRICDRGRHIEQRGCKLESHCIESELIKRNCGHSISIKCYENESEVIAKNICTEMVTTLCKRQHHYEQRNCNSGSYCTEPVLIKRNCGHSISIRCHENENVVIAKNICMEMDTTVCKRGNHTEQRRCGSDSHCMESVSTIFSCGHTLISKCWEDSRKICPDKITKTCKKGLHKYTVLCADYPNPNSVVFCSRPIEVTRPCGHLVTIKCSQDEDDINKFPCKIEITKTCARNKHVKTVACSDEALCTEIITLQLPCGHHGTTKCNDTTDIKCMEKIVSKCQGKRHKITKLCWMKTKCNFKYSSELSCGCRNIIDCDDYRENAPTLVCTGDCKIAIIKRYASDENNIVKNINGTGDGELCGHSLISVPCHKICGKTLRCGHKCKRTCESCLRGRLHGSCLEVCSKRLGCGDACREYCHVGPCVTCPKKCLLSKLRNIFDFDHKVPYFDQSQWVSLINPWLTTGHEEMKLRLKIMLFDIQEKRFSKEMISKYQIIYRHLKFVLDFYGSFVQENLSFIAKEYSSIVDCTILVLVKWLTPEDFERHGSCVDDFLLEFQRIEVYRSFCGMADSWMSRNVGKDPRPFYDILDALRSRKYDKDLQLEMSSRVATILTNQLNE